MNGSNLQEQARQVLDRFFAGIDIEPALAEGERIAAQRRNFLNAFGPERLAGWSKAELLRSLPYNLADDRPLDYWLEFRNDAVFNTRLFGGIGGGSAAKFGVWQDRRSGRWRAPPPGARAVQDIDEEQALAILEERRREMLAAVQALTPLLERSLRELDATVVQTTVAAAAPRWRGGVWLHKYLHLALPTLVTWNATLTWSQAALYRLGQVAAGAGLYALDIQLLQCLDSLPALARVPPWLRYRLLELPPREHWGLHLAGAVDARQTMLAEGELLLGPAQVGNLAGLFSLSRKAEARQGLAVAFREAGLAVDPRQAQALLKLGYSLQPGAVIALFSDPLTVTAVGEISGGYRYGAHPDRPHRLPVRWLRQQPFLLSAPVDISDHALRRLPPDSAAAADLEAALWLAGGQPERPANPGVREPKPDYATLAPPTGLIGELLDMLERRLQIVLYGPPGVGKTYYAEQTAVELAARYNCQRLPSQLTPAELDRLYGRDGGDPFIVFCTFHPLYGYEDFIEGYRPEPQGFSLKSGVFRRLATAAQSRPDKRFVLIIDELNRGNIPKIFGELITLLEPSRRGSGSVILPLSGARFSVPANLYLIAAMNTADRSILLLDTALRRRFGFKELLPQPELLASGAIGAAPLSVWLEALNRRIRRQLGRDGRNLQVGHAYFMPNGKPVTALTDIAAIVREAIWPLLQEYCYDDSRALAAILAADQGGIYDQERDDLRYELFTPGREDELIKALLAVVTAGE